jgi:hypothetical protein
MQQKVFSVWLMVDERFVGARLVCSPNRLTGERSTPGLASYRLPKITHWPCRSIISTANIKIMGQILKLVQWSARPEEQVKKKFWLGDGGRPGSGSGWADSFFWQGQCAQSWSMWLSQLISRAQSF